MSGVIVPYSWLMLAELVCGLATVMYVYIVSVVNTLLYAPLLRSPTELLILATIMGVQENPFI